MALIKYNGETLAEIKAGQSITLHTDGHELEGDLVIEGFNGGGSSNCDGCIIEVEELPTGDDIDKGAIYYAAIKFADTYLVIQGGAMAGTLTDLIGAEGGQVNSYVVSTLPEEITDDIPKSDMNSGVLNCFYVEKGTDAYPSDIYVCMLNENTNAYEWVTLATLFSFFSITFKGVIGGENEVSGDGYYVLSGTGYFKYYDASFDDFIVGGDSLKADCAGLFYAETTPDNPKTSDLTNYIIYAYYIADPAVNDIKAYNGTEWVSASTLLNGLAFGGAIVDAEKAEDNTKYYAVITPAGLQKLIPEKDAGSPPPSVEENKTVTPTTYTQTVEPSSGYDYFAKVTVNPIPSNYIVPSGTETITANGTYDVTSKASAKVNVPSPSGTITISTNGTHDVTKYATAVVSIDEWDGSNTLSDLE